MKKSLVTIFALATALIAQAEPISGNLSVDFRTPAWNVAGGQHTFSSGGVTATAFALNLGGNQVDAKLSQNGTDGLGVDSTILGEDPGEVGPREILTISFIGSSGFGLTGAWLTQLFDEIVDDVGSVSLYGSSGLISTIGFSGNGNDASGNYLVDFGGPLNLTSAVFYADSSLGSVLLNRDYSVAAFTKQANVPDSGTTGLMLGLALLGLGFARRSKRVG